jgi:high-affinity nickel permease
MNDILSGNFRNRIAGIYGFLVAVNLGAWVWAIIAFHDKPVLLGTAVLAYTFGLRHAVDADHIAAIDNVSSIESKVSTVWHRRHLLGINALVVEKF